MLKSRFKCLLLAAMVLITGLGVVIGSEVTEVRADETSWVGDTVKITRDGSVIGNLVSGVTTYSHGFTVTNQETGQVGYGFCMNKGSAWPDSHTHTLTGRYTADPEAIGVYANGYPTYKADMFAAKWGSEFDNLTDVELVQATQIAVWAALGQVGLSNSPFTNGSKMNINDGDANGASGRRVLAAARTIMNEVWGNPMWKHTNYIGMYLRLDEDKYVFEPADNPDINTGNNKYTESLASVGDSGEDKWEIKEFGGEKYVMRKYYIATATPPIYADYNVYLAVEGVEGAKVMYGDGVPLAASTESGYDWQLRLPETAVERPGINLNGVEYVAPFYLAIPYDKASAAGSVKLKATTTAANYEIFQAITDGSHQNVLVSAPTEASVATWRVVEWGGTSTTGFKLYKKDAANLTGANLADAVFTFTADDGKVIEGKTKTDGSVEFMGGVTELPAGHYKVKEKTPPAGYKLGTAEQDLNWDNTADKSLTFKNEKITDKKFTLYKKDSSTNKALEGATFEFKSGNTTKTGTTNSSGEIVFVGSELPNGTYTVTEKSAPSGYELDSTPQTLVWDNTADKSLTFMNTGNPPPPPPGSPKKYRRGTTIGLAGAQFRVTQLSHWEKRLVDPNGDDTHEFYDDDNGDELNEGDPGYHHEVVDLADDVWEWIEFKETEIVGTFVSQADGSIPVGALEAGSYTIEEIVPPDGYVLSDIETERLQFFDVPRTGGYVWNIVFENWWKSGLIIWKYDEGTGKPLPNAEFSVKHNGNIIWQGMTDSNGKIDVKELKSLDSGWYEIEELAAPPGYLIRDKIKSVFIDNGKEDYVIKFDNRKKPELELIKLDAQTGKALAGAVFKVSEAEGKLIGEYTTNAQGKINIPELQEIVYSIEEIAAPEGYLIDPDSHRDVKLEWGKTTSVVFKNEPKPKLKLIKLDELTNKPIAGASFRLWKTEGETWSETLVTNENGEILWENLDPAIYSLQEIDEPFGYFKDPNRKEILLKGGDSKVLEFFNRPRPILTILKHDKITGEPIQNVKFLVQKVEGETIGEFLTDANGRIELSPKTGYLLEEAIYRVTEVTAPNEYLLGEIFMKEVKLKWYEPTELIYENLLKPTLIFIKRDGLSGRGISGATYKVEYESPMGGVTNLGSYVTKCGLIVIPYVLPGWYSLTETKAAAGYSLPTNPTQRLHLAPGENSYTYAQTHEDLYVDDRTNPNRGSKGMCGDCCGYLCSTLCAGNCGNPGDGTMSSGDNGAFGNIKITNEKGETIVTGNGENNSNNGSNQTDTTPPVLSAGAATREGNLTAKVQFTSTEAGKYYYVVANSGAAEPTITTSGLGTACMAGSNTITVYVSSGAKDVYIKVKDAAGNVSNALKISVPAYNSQSESQSQNGTDSGAGDSTEKETGKGTNNQNSTSNTPNGNGNVIYVNPLFPSIVIKFGSY